ncbi:MAG: phosphotransferase [Patescibacteria group bacterium]
MKNIPQDQQDRKLEAEIQSLSAILSFFGLSQMTETPVILKGGIANHNYLIKAANGKAFVIKILINQAIDSVKNEVAIQKQLNKAGLISTAFIQNHDGSYLYEHDGIFAVVSSKIDGVHPKVVDEPLARDIGRALASFHQSVINIPYPHEGWLNKKEAARTFSLLPDSYLKRNAESLIKRGEFIYNKNLPTGIIHGDLCSTNLFVKAEGDSEVIAVFDLEEAEENLLLVDLARTIIAGCSDNSGRKLLLHLVRSMLDGYSSVRTLTQDESLFLSDAIKYTSGVCALWFLKNGFPEHAEEQIKRGQNLMA